MIRPITAIYCNNPHSNFLNPQFPISPVELPEQHGSQKKDLRIFKVKNPNQFLRFEISTFFRDPRAHAIPIGKYHFRIRNDIITSVCATIIGYICFEFVNGGLSQLPEYPCFLIISTRYNVHPMFGLGSIES